jgi:hypothetical protein
VLFGLVKIKFLQTFVELINIGYGLVNDGFTIIFAEFHRKVFLFYRMEKRTNFRLVTA